MQSPADLRHLLRTPSQLVFNSPSHIDFGLPLFLLSVCVCMCACVHECVHVFVLACVRMYGRVNVWACGCASVSIISCDNLSKPHQSTVCHEPAMERLHLLRQAYGYSLWCIYHLPLNARCFRFTSDTRRVSTSCTPLSTDDNS